MTQRNSKIPKEPKSKWKDPRREKKKAIIVLTFGSRSRKSILTKIRRKWTLILRTRHRLAQQSLVPQTQQSLHPFALQVFAKVTHKAQAQVAYSSQKAGLKQWRIPGRNLDFTVSTGSSHPQLRKGTGRQRQTIPNMKFKDRAGELRQILEGFRSQVLLQGQFWSCSNHLKPKVK